MTTIEPIVLAPPSPRYKQLYSEERLRIAIRLGRMPASIEHIGSTAIDGIQTKPIIDILIGLREPPLSVAVEPLTELGYEYMPGVGSADRLFFRRGSPRAYHVHVVLFDGEEWRRHVIFRDWLNLHPELAKEYEAVKRDLAEKHRDDRAAYTAGKAAIIERAIAEAAKFPALRLLR